MYLQQLSVTTVTRFDSHVGLKLREPPSTSWTLYPVLQASVFQMHRSLAKRSFLQRDNIASHCQRNL